ncbi:zinc-ribbon domain-containing protein, partial [Acidaminococcus sp.]|uniref:zinc-ribbon domain-containing protein n=1 Tax=Acidaminococcus sp. TaxID=1872103 RepID=UPI003AB6D2DB
MANFCPQCGARLAPTSKFCPQCGVRIASNSPQEETSAQTDVSTIQAEEKVPTAPANPPKEETTSSHFTTSQPAQTPKTAENYLTMLKNDLTIEGRLNRKRYWVRTGLCIVLNIIAAIFMEIPAELPLFFGAILTIA